MPLIIPLNAVPSQVVGVQLNGQNCQISCYQRFFGLFLDLYVSGNLIIAGVLCLNLTLLVRSTYLGFVGDLCFLDNQGGTNPTASGLGARYSLAYLAPDDLAELGRPLISGEM
jgi:hypothetical protein